MKNMIKVGMAEYKLARVPEILTTLGLGSCIGICLYDKQAKIAGLAHIMLPSSTQIKNNTNRAKFADTAIELLLNDIITLGASKNRITAKIAGGAQMFAFTNNTNNLMKIGSRNAEATKSILKKFNIKILAEDTGGNYGRTIEFNPSNGELFIKTIGHGVKTI
ncbi:MAG: chemotaxis protein CheD [Alkaliphilus sp.]